MLTRTYVSRVALLEGKAAIPGGARRTRAYTLDQAKITEIARLANLDTVPTPQPDHAR